MKTNEFFDAMGKIDPTLIERADKKVAKKHPFVKITALAAAVALLAGGMIVALPLLIGEGNTKETIVGEDSVELLAPIFGSGEAVETGDASPGKYPINKIITENYAAYHIEIAYPSDKTDEFIGEKISDIMVLNAWGYYGQTPVVKHDEKLVNAEVYTVKGVAPDAGVAVKFTEEGSIYSTELYYAAVNSKYLFTTLAEYLADYNASVHMMIGSEVRLCDNSRMYAYEYEKYNFTDGAADEICKYLLTLNASAEVANYYDTKDERIVDVKNKRRLRLIVDISSSGNIFRELYIHENGYIFYGGQLQECAYFNVGKEATDTLFKLFEENSELVSFVTIDKSIGRKVEIPADKYIPR